MTLIDMFSEVVPTQISVTVLLLTKQTERQSNTSADIDKLMNWQSIEAMPDACLLIIPPT